MNKNTKYKKQSSKKYIYGGMFVRYFDETKNIWILKANYKRILLFLVSTALLLWLLGTSSIFAYFKYVKKFDEIKFSDAILAPIKMAEIRKKMGEFNIKQSEELFSQKRFNEAFVMLTSGVARSPDNLKALMKLALIHANALNNTEYASVLLERKLATAFDTKNKSYILLTSFIFSKEEKSEKKSSLLLAKALSENIITQEEAITTLTSIFANKNNTVDKGIRYFYTALKSFEKHKRVQQFVAKSTALLLLKDDNPIQAQEVLQNANVLSGEVFMQVHLMNLLHTGREIEAINYLNKLLVHTKSPTSVYALAKEIHALFGNQKEVENAQRMEYLTMPTQTPIEIYSAVKNNDTQKLKKILDTKSPTVLLQAIKIASVNKNVQVLSLYKDAINKIEDKQNKTVVMLALCETYIRLNNPLKAEEILLEVRSKNKNVKFEELINFLHFAKTLTTKNITIEQIKNFRSNVSVNMLKKLVQLFVDSGYYNEALDTINFAKLQNAPIKNEPVMLFDIYNKLGDDITIAKLLSKYPNKCPIKILISEKFKNPNSDKFIMLSNQERISLNSEIQKANKKMQQYKAMYNF